MDISKAFPLYRGTTSAVPARVTPYTGKTADAHKGAGKGKDIRTRQRPFSISPTVQVFKSQADYDAGKVSHEIGTTRNNATNKRRAKAAVKKQRVLSEVEKYGAMQHDKLTLDEIRANNGL